MFFREIEEAANREGNRCWKKYNKEKQNSARDHKSNQNGSPKVMFSQFKRPEAPPSGQRAAKNGPKASSDHGEGQTGRRMFASQAPRDRPFIKEHRLEQKTTELDTPRADGLVNS